MHRVAGWWDSFELWVAGLPFIPQFLVVLVGMVPISFAIAYVLDRVLRAVLRLLDQRHDRPSPTAPQWQNDAAVTTNPAPVRDGIDDEVALVRHPAQSGAR
ncbi:hypothetical protein [Nocardia callitridis]|uniref:DUF4282 domain-containing protein n=1 Tax=Nocardia callitridis TaxID=648753 RepID=A0ABP9L2N2_9NOCA